MNGKPISEAKDPDLRNADIAIKRAAIRAREIAKESGTLLVINRNGETILISPDDIDDSLDSFSGDMDSDSLLAESTSASFVKAHFSKSTIYTSATSALKHQNAPIN